MIRVERCKSALQAPPLVVTTNLTTESVQGKTQGGQGSRMDKNGVTRKVVFLLQ